MYRMISFNKGTDLAHCSKNWQVAQFTADLITKSYYSPIVWVDGHRKSSNFLYADHIVVDVDDGVSMHKCQDILAGMSYLIAPTKSHLKDKGGKVCERFRVVLPLLTRCSVAEHYQHTTNLWIERLGGDKACKDLARMYAPSTSIFDNSLCNPVLAGWTVAPPKKEHQSSADGKMTAWLLKQLNIGFYTQGTRNCKIYGVARELKKHNYAEELAAEMICCRTDLSEREVKIIVRSAYQKA